MSDSTQPNAWEMFKPPVNRAMRVLDRLFFQRVVPLAAALIFDKGQIAPCRRLLGQDVLDMERISSVTAGPSNEHKQQDLKALLLSPTIKPADRSTWSRTLLDLVDEQKVSVIPYDLQLSYNYWTYLDIMKAIIPEEDQEELPTGFSVVGHVAHLNLRSQFIPYKHLVASVLMDKNPAVKTVINKIDEVGMQNEFRTFQYELLAGDPSLVVEVKEQDCVFRFDYSKVYWNSRLNTEHERLVAKFNPGEAVCDVMAGIGPFAVPAGKKKVFVWANDLNPDSYAYLKDAISRNKVSNFVRAFNEDGRKFIRTSVQELLNHDHEVDVTVKLKKQSRSGVPLPPVPPTFMVQPKVFDHFVMNLPATAIAFLDAFIGLYRGQESLFGSETSRKLPMIHVHCFSPKDDDIQRSATKICEEVSERIGHPIHPGQEDVEIWDVRDVAPQKRMFCASFRLPREVAFR